MFKTEGNVDVTIIDAYVSQAKFQAEQGETNNRNEYVQVFYDVTLQLQDAAGNTDFWHGEISSRTGTGNFAHLYRLDLTLKTLQDIGFNVTTVAELEGQFMPKEDRTVCIPNLIGIRATAVVVKSEKTDRNGNPYFNVRYLNALGAGGSRKLTFEELMARRGGAAQPANPPPPTAGTSQIRQTPPPAAPAAIPPPAVAAPAPQSPPPAVALAQVPPPTGNPPPPAGNPPPPAAAPGAPGTPGCPY